MEIPPRGTRGTRIPGGALLRTLGRRFIAGQISRYRKATAPEPQVSMGMPTVLLTTVGSRTGHEHTSVVTGFRDADDWIVVASNGGAPAHPHWFVNMAKNPDRVWLEVGNRKMKVAPTLLRGTERAAVLDKVVARFPRYGGYQKKTDREIPVVRLKAG